VGTLSLWKRAHKAVGNECSYVTFFPSPKKYEDDICLALPFTFSKSLGRKLRKMFYFLKRGKLAEEQEIKGEKIWSPSKVESLYFQLKNHLWRKPIYRAIDNHKLDDFDVYHLEWGTEFFRDGRFVKNMKDKGKKIICHYHGQDVRIRGILPEIDKLSDLNLTSELDLLTLRPDFKYLFLPFDTKQFIQKTDLNNKIRLCHSPTNRYYKGSDNILFICHKLESEGLIDFDLIENLSHKTTIERKQKADIFIDQIGDKGGWGYGMNSVESLSMGICTLTEMNQKYCDFLPDHPFVNINEETFETVLRQLINNRSKILDYGKKGKEWVDKYHHFSEVKKTLYTYYRKIGLSV